MFCTTWSILLKAQVLTYCPYITGTNIGKALDVAVELINKGVDWTVPAPAAAVNATEPADGNVQTAATTQASTTAAAAEVAVKKGELSFYIYFAPKVD